MNVGLCDDTEGDEDGAGEFRVDGDNEEQGEELRGLDTGGPLPRNKDIESGKTSGRGFGLALGLVKRFAVISLLDSCERKK